ncbi:hypothetical protein [Bacillus marinisedimentorum]|uniref:hypothetical protein n=1 Tax=Bacillus marinisedimentorum TaxID=1821260 RepID=UPI0007DE75F6|nr:hypothetical protein [Bacillus marinisedimentorum]
MENGMENGTEKKMYITHLLEQPIKGKIAVSAVDEKHMKTNKGTVLITLLMTDGLEFISHLNFPVSDRIRLILEFPAGEEQWSLLGSVRHKKQYRGYLNKYIFHFQMEGKPLYEMEFRNMLKELAVKTAWETNVPADDHLH